MKPVLAGRSGDNRHRRGAMRLRGGSVLRRRWVVASAGERIAECCFTRSARVRSGEFYDRTHTGRLMSVATVDIDNMCFVVNVGADEAGGRFGAAAGHTGAYVLHQLAAGVGLPGVDAVLGLERPSRCIARCVATGR